MNSMHAQIAQSRALCGSRMNASPQYKRQIRKSRKRKKKKRKQMQRNNPEDAQSSVQTGGTHSCPGYDVARILG
jgi:hypothetical protein